MRGRVWLAALAVLLTWSCLGDAWSQERPSTTPAAAPKPIPGIGPAGEMARLHTGFAFTEGPAADAQGNVFFTDVRGNRIHRVDTEGKLSTFLEDTKGCNGLMFDGKGRLIACQGGEGRVIAIDVATKAIQVVADKFDGKRFNRPNDLVVDRQGGVYFTDPVFGQGERPQEKECVYYVAPDGHVARLIDDQPRPNGVLLSPDEKTLYVLLSGRPGLMAYPVETPGKLGPGKSLGNVERPGDGLTVDTKGNLYLTQPSLNTVQVIAPDGQTLGLIPVPEAPSNCAFGGKDMKTLYITARTSLYAVKMDATGHRFGGPAPKVTGAALRVPAVAAAPAPKASPLVLRLGGPGVDFGKDVAVDSAGNVIVTGYFVGAVDFDPGPGAAMLTSSGVVDQFLAKYDANGRHLWSFALGGPGADMPHSVVADRAGNLYLAGYFSARVDFDPGPGSAVLTSKGERDAYVAKYDPNGKYLWAVSLGGPQTDEANCLAVDDAGNAYVTGNFEGSLDAAPGVSLRGAGGLDAFVAKFDANGKFAWAFALGGPGDDKGHGLAVDSSGNCYVSGAFNSAVDFDPGPNRTALTSAGGSDIFLACYKPSGALAWAKRMGGSGDDFAGVGAISVDGRGILHLSGMFSQTAAFDDLRLTSAGLTDIFFGKFAPDGKCLWARGVGGPAQDTGHRILADRDGSVYLTGSFHRRADFDPGPGVQTLTAENPDGDIFVAKYDAAGKLLWAHGFGDAAPGATGARSSGPMTLANQPKYSIGAGLALDASDRPIVTGRFFGSVDFDPLGGQTITSAGESDVFLVRFNPDGRP